ncbi:rna-directed dna polymerase from mobile element jockey-like protein, partial [Lasius niger]
MRQHIISSTLLDLCIVDDDEKLMDYGQQGAAFLSAHDLIYIKYAIKIQRRRGRRVVCRDWRDFDADSFQTDVSGIDWTSLISSNNIDEKIEIYNSELLRIFDSHVPLRQRNFKNLPAPWLRGDIQQAMRDRDLARRVWRRRRNDANYNRYKALRNSAQKLVRQAKQDYYNNIFNRARDANGIWNGLRHLGLIKSKDTGKCLTHAAGELNRFFVGYEAAQSMNEHDTLDDVLTGNFDEERFHWSYITPLRIRRAITRTKSNAVGLDGISLLLLKFTINSTMPIIEHLFNFSLMQGAFPKQWKVALIRPIPKIRNPTLCQHYRPISILPTLSKALERVVCEQIQDYLEGAGLCDPCQSAYRSNHSIQTRIIRMLDDVRYAADLRKITVSVFFDFSKAFDRVDHLTLIRKLNNLNFSDSTLRWVHSYLTGRTQAVKDDSNGTLSSPLPVVAGVPQGSVLGPLLFTMYLTDFGRVLRHCKYNFYADDLQIYIHCEPRDIHVAIRNINDDIEAIKNWTIANRLLLNPEKTQAIIMGTSRFINSTDLSTIPAVRVNGTSLQYSTSVRYLGVTILNTMSWEMQVTKISNKVNSVLYQLKLSKHLLPEALKVRLVIALVFPHIDYCCAAYTDLVEVYL